MNHRLPWRGQQAGCGGELQGRGGAADVAVRRPNAVEGFLRGNPLPRVRCW